MANGTASPPPTATFQALRGLRLSAKFDQTEETADLDAWVIAFEQAVAAAPEANPVRTVYDSCASPAAGLTSLEPAIASVGNAEADA